LTASSIPPWQHRTPHRPLTLHGGRRGAVLGYPQVQPVPCAQPLQQYVCPPAFTPWPLFPFH
jgi:hypothetical protein